MAEIIRITDFSDSRLDAYARLSEAQLLNRDDPYNASFIAESPKVIERALDAGFEPVSILIEDRHIETQGKDIIARCNDIPVFTASFDVLTQLTGYMLTRGMLCLMRRPECPCIDELLSSSRRIAVLENIMNPTNVGAIFRSAAALGIDSVILSSDCSDPLYRRSIRVSMGTVFQVPWCFADKNGDSLIDYLHAQDYKCAAFALRNNSTDIRSSSLKNEPRLAVILGSEGEGLLTETIDKCDYVIKIPMSHGVDSLNVSAAAALAFWELGNNNL